MTFGSSAAKTLNIIFLAALAVQYSTQLGRGWAANSEETFTTLHRRPGLRGNTFSSPAVRARAELTFRDRKQFTSLRSEKLGNLEMLPNDPIGQRKGGGGVGV